MKLQVQHILNYSYNGLVVLQPQTLYLYPKSYPHQKVIDYNLLIEPKPTKVVRNVDAEGNVQQVAYFSGNQVDHLRVTADMTLSSESFNAFDFVHFPYNTRNLTFNYDDRIYKYLFPYLDRSDVTGNVTEFAQTIANQAAWGTVSFLMTLAKHIFENFSYMQRKAGNAFHPDDTLQQKSGSCRDFSRLYIACCRSLGIASRFVSGYLYGNLMQAHELHGWVEVYLPGAGWRGFDPTEGKAVVNNHISLGASSDFDELAPVMGSFNGVASSSLITNLYIRRIG